VEWLEQGAATEILDVDDAGKDAAERRYSLPAGHDEALLDETSLNFIAPIARLVAACGQGFSTLAIARAYPKVHVDGIDSDEASIAAAERNLEGSGVEDRVSFQCRDAAGVEEGRYDLVCIDEAVVIGDERVADSFTVPGDDLERFYYGFSMLHCLPVGRGRRGRGRNRHGHAGRHRPSLCGRGRSKGLRGAPDRERLLPLLPTGAVVVNESVRLADKLASFDEVFAPKIVAYYNGNKIQVGKVKGEFVWHSHPDTDDFFLVLKGHLTIQLRDRDVELGPGNLFVVPRGVEHRPRADDEAHILLIEPEGTPNVGDADAEAAPEVEI
jgi:mannose-6-phosphate isomerase-like protein (cupin superfamily)